MRGGGGGGGVWKIWFVIDDKIFSYHSVKKPATPSFSASLILISTTSLSIVSHTRVFRG